MIADKIYGVMTLNGKEYLTCTPPEEFKVISDGWMKYWVEFIDTTDHVLKINCDLIVGVRTHVRGQMS